MTEYKSTIEKILNGFVWHSNLQEQTKSLLAEDENKGTCYFQPIERKQTGKKFF